MGYYRSMISWGLFAYTLNSYCIHVKTRSDTHQEIEENLANQVVDMLEILFSFVLGCGNVRYNMVMSFKQKEIHFKPRIKLNHNREK